MIIKLNILYVYVPEYSDHFYIATTFMIGINKIRTFDVKIAGDT